MSNSDIIATASVVVAALAFFTTAWQTWVAHKHSRLSVKPFLSWGTTRNNTHQAFEVIVALSNFGVGPAIVRERYFTLDGCHFESPDGRSAVEALVEKLLPDDWGCRVAGQGLPGEGTAIPPGATIRIARLLFRPVVFEEQGELARLMERVRFVVVYDDLYDNRDVFRT
ncbi:hypothetical protein [Acidovorax sp. SRB_24]|uniref:hypothetical protein n=1 Tax=Acidovorax sp. SRB_24 TaxID=1962700 RepID=UPI00145D9304|nr:hypothetical protein [Acidovorax sp. SRB_24]